MIYPDSLLSNQCCPICDRRLMIDRTTECIIYHCDESVSLIDGRCIFHYEFMRFKNKAIATNYIINSWWVVADESYTTIHKLTKITYKFHCENFGWRETSLLLGCDNFDKVKKKLKIWTIFS